MNCLRFLVKGKVQGVWYRKYTSLAMNKEKIIGFVRNLANGDVEVVIKNTPNLDTQKIYDILYKGSPASIVEEVIMQECDKEYQFSHIFEVRY